MGIYRGTNKLIGGAGVIVCEDYKTKNGMISCILLGRNRSSRKFTDFGGSFEAHKHKDPTETAVHELAEESRNLFKLSRKHFTIFNDIPAGKYFYRVFFIKINGASRKYFYHNMKKIDNSHASRSWKETDKIAHVPINKNNLNMLKQNSTMRTVDEKLVTVDGRCKKAILSGINELVEVLKKKATINKNNLTKNRTHDFTNDTFSFIS